MRKIIAVVVTMAFMFVALLAFAPAASATDHAIPSPDNNKTVTFCHATASKTNPYNTLTTSVNVFYTAGHISHEADGKRDIYPGFTWTDNKGISHTVAPQGDQSLLAFPDCQRPPTDEVIAVPAVNSVDKCETKDDTVTPVRDNSKYTTVVGPRVGDSVTVTFTAKNGFVFTGGQKVVEVTVNFPNNDACDLPETGGPAQYNTLAGIAALTLLGMAALGVVIVRQRA